MTINRDDAIRAEGEDLAALILRVIDENPGLSQKGIAEKSGIPLATINAWVTRRRGTSGRIDPDSLRKLAAVLPKTTVKQVFESTGRRAPANLDQEREKKLLRLWRQMDAQQQRSVLDMVEVMVRQPKGRAAE
ncbi:transcriptional regulator with XRE-family HTH domain [Streptacidiphilus sp. MAP12-33]|uniref:winged helix-turn-helix transcriptional regulator n=1 Tax=Streptacidiphilus sp. MAP12-33 TaxID=3156266 RepID=UPI00351804F9